MTFGEALEAAGQIIDDVLNSPGIGSQRFKLNAENKPLIDELIAAANCSPFLEWHVLGSVGQETAYFIIRAKYRDMFGPGEPPGPGGEVIYVDFKAKARIKQAA